MMGFIAEGGRGLVQRIYGNQISIGPRRRKTVSRATNLPLALAGRSPIRDWLQPKTIGSAKAEFLFGSLYPLAKASGKLAKASGKLAKLLASWLKLMASQLKLAQLS